jgi:uncharacterized protein (DUF58 family)
VATSRAQPKTTLGLDWGELAPLRLRARAAADGAWSGLHRSVRRGAGVEFAGHRAYVPGDDLRWLDRHALMRHGALMLREFETETDRTLRLLVDASGSMAFRGSRGRGAKLAYAAVIGLALAWIATHEGDRVALDWLGSEKARPLPGMGGGEAFERVALALEHATPEGALTSDEDLARALVPIERNARRGSLVAVMSDLVDLPESALERLTGLGHRGRTLVVVQVLDPDELDFPYEGPVRLRALEGDRVVDTDASAVRAAYLEELERRTKLWHNRLGSRGARLIVASTADDPSEVVRRILVAFRGGAR